MYRMYLMTSFVGEISNVLILKTILAFLAVARPFLSGDCGF